MSGRLPCFYNESLMRRFRPTRAALAATGLFILACGGLGDTGLFEEPYCEVDCPHGSYEVADNESSDQCSSTCAPLAECPPWGVPQVTDECYSCAHIAEDGKLLPLLPAGQQTEEQLIDNLRSPQVRQALGSLQSAIAGDSFNSVLANFQLDTSSARVQEAMNSGNMILAFLESVIDSVERK